MAKRTTAVRINGRELQLSNLDKVLYPKEGFTKAAVIDYYRFIAPYLLPHLKNRPITLKRYPDGVDQFFFYEKRCPSFRPRWVRLSNLPTSKSDDDEMRLCVVNDLPTLIWIVNLASIELHPYLCTTKNLDHPTAMVFDLDPGAPAALIDAAEIALRLRDRLDSIGLKSWLKSSGGKGVHVYVPLNTPIRFEETKQVARSLAIALEQDDPKRVTSNMRKIQRKGKVFIDWSQNDQHKTTVAPYSLRARERPTVSAPLKWEEVEAAVHRRKPERLIFDAISIRRRIEDEGDLFRPVLSVRQRLGRASMIRKTK